MCDKAKVGQALLHLIRQQVRKHMKTQKTLHMLQIARKHTSFILPRYMPSWTKFLNPSPEHLKRDFGGQGNQPASHQGLHGLPNPPVVEVWSPNHCQGQPNQLNQPNDCIQAAHREHPEARLLRSENAVDDKFVDLLNGGHLSGTRFAVQRAFLLIKSNHETTIEKIQQKIVPVFKTNNIFNSIESVTWIEILI